MASINLESKYVINDIVIIARKADIESALNCPSLCQPGRLAINTMREILGRMIKQDPGQIRYASRNCTHRWLVVGDNADIWCLTMSLHRVVTIYDSAETQAYDFIFPQSVGEYDLTMTMEEDQASS